MNKEYIYRDNKIFVYDTFVYVNIMVHGASVCVETDIFYFLVHVFLYENNKN